MVAGAAMGVTAMGVFTLAEKIKERKLERFLLKKHGKENCNEEFVKSLLEVKSYQ